VKVVLFCIILFHLLRDDCQSIPNFFFFIFHKSFYIKFLNLHRYAKKIVSTTRYESLFFSLICLINSGYTLVNQSTNEKSMTFITSCTNNYSRWIRFFKFQTIWKWRSPRICTLTHFFLVITFDQVKLPGCKISMFVWTSVPLKIT
jgi:hypothetical protein